MLALVLVFVLVLVLLGSTSYFAKFGNSSHVRTLLLYRSPKKLPAGKEGKQFPKSNKKNVFQVLPPKNEDIPLKHSGTGRSSGFPIEIFFSPLFTGTLVTFRLCTPYFFFVGYLLDHPFGTDGLVGLVAG